MRRETAKLTLCGMMVVCLFASGSVAQVGLLRVWQEDTGGTAYDVAVSGSYTFVSNNSGVSIYDVRSPEQPRLASLFRTPSGGAFGLCAEGTTLFVAAISDGLLVVDVSDPESPVQTGSYGRDVDDVFVHDRIAYLSIMFGGGTLIVDVSEPVNPVELAQIGNISGAAATGTTMWAGDPGRGVVRFDISNPSSPLELGIIPGTHGVNSLELRAGTLFVARYSLGTRIYDVSLPASPRLLLDAPDSGEAWHASGEYPIVCVADLQEGVEVLDGSRSQAERLIAREETLAPHSLFYRNGYLHVADQNEGYVLLRLDLQPTPRRVRGRRHHLQ